MLACAGIDRQPELEPSWAPGLVGRRGGCDRELYADADGRVYACQPAVSRVMRGAAVGGLVHLCEERARAGRLGLGQAQGLERAHFYNASTRMAAPPYFTAMTN